MGGKEWRRDKGDIGRERKERRKPKSKRGRKRGGTVSDPSKPVPTLHT